jgi:hypothetical protein
MKTVHPLLVVDIETHDWFPTMRHHCHLFAILATSGLCVIGSTNYIATT